VIGNFIFNNTKSISNTDGWYNHSVYNPSSYHFCSAMRLVDMKRIDGFDEHYAKGVAFDDDELLYRIRQKKFNIEQIDSCRVIHQWHHVAQSSTKNNSKHWRRNKLLFEYMTKKNVFFIVVIFLFYIIEFRNSLLRLIKKNGAIL